MAQDLVDFSDIATAVANEMKVQTDDTVQMNRIKRIINMVYLDEVVPFADWWWLKGSTDVRQEAYYSTGTASVAEGSASVTISGVIAASKARHYFAVEGHEEIYEISAHTAGTDAITLRSAYTGTTNTTASYKIWTDRIALPTDLIEVTAVSHDWHPNPLDARGPSEIRQLKASYGTRREGRPEFYSTLDFYDPSGGSETDSDRYRELQVFPALNTEATTLHIDYDKEVSSLDLDGDEPAMPLQDRSVLYFGALAICWASIGRNPEEAARNQALYDRKLARMAGKRKKDRDKPKLEVSRLYMAYKRRARGRRGWSNF